MNILEMYIVEDLLLSVDHAFNLAAGKYELRNSLLEKDAAMNEFVKSQFIGYIFFVLWRRVVLDQTF